MNSGPCRRSLERPESPQCEVVLRGSRCSAFSNSSTMREMTNEESLRHRRRELLCGEGGGREANQRSGGDSGAGGGQEAGGQPVQWWSPGTISGKVPRYNFSHRCSVFTLGQSLALLLPPSGPSFRISFISSLFLLQRRSDLPFPLRRRRRHRSPGGVTGHARAAHARPTRFNAIQ